MWRQWNSSICLRVDDNEATYGGTPNFSDISIMPPVETYGPLMAYASINLRLNDHKFDNNKATHGDTLNFGDRSQVTVGGKLIMISNDRGHNTAL